MHVRVTRSGGFANLLVTGAVDTTDVPEAEGAELERLIDDLDLDDLAGRSPIRGQGVDRFQYELSIRRGDREHQAVVSEDAAPPALLEVAKAVLRHASRAG